MEKKQSYDANFRITSGICSESHLKGAKTDVKRISLKQKGTEQLIPPMISVT